MRKLSVLASAMALLVGLVSVTPQAEARRGFGVGGIVAAAVLGGVIAASISHRRAYAYYPRRTYYHGPSYAYAAPVYYRRPVYSYSAPVYYRRPVYAYRTVRVYRPVRAYRHARIYRSYYHAPRRAHWSRRWR